MTASGIVNRFFYEPANKTVTMHFEGDAMRYEFNMRSIRSALVAMTKPGDLVEVEVCEADPCDRFVRAWKNHTYDKECGK